MLISTSTVFSTGQMVSVSSAMTNEARAIIDTLKIAKNGMSSNATHHPWTHCSHIWVTTQYFGIDYLSSWTVQRAGFIGFMMKSRIDTSSAHRTQAPIPFLIGTAPLQWDRPASI